MSEASDSPEPCVPPARAINERHRRFVLEYIIDLNGRAAAVRAGYARGKAASRATELIRKPALQAMIREELAARAARTRVGGDRIIRELARIAFADPSRIARWGPDGVELARSEDMTEDDKAAVKWISVGGRKGAHAQRFELHDKIGALDLLARMTGLLTRGKSGRFALLEESTAEREARRAQHEENLAKLQRLIEAKATVMAHELFDKMKAAEALAFPSAPSAPAGPAEEGPKEPLS